jgi:hypothetical protein
LLNKDNAERDEKNPPNTDTHTDTHTHTQTHKYPIDISKLAHL